MKHARIQMNVMLVLMAVGAMGPPLLGPVRETLQDAGGLSRAELGKWVFLLGLGGSTAGLAFGVLMRRTVRTTFMRAGTVVLCLACAALAAVRPAPGWPLLVLGTGWFMVSVARPLVASSNGIFADLWESSPHTGLIILHATNSVGKLLAPVAVMVLGTVLARTALVYVLVFGLLALESLFWPAAGLKHLKQVERDRDEERRLRLPRDPAVWACVAQFGFISGSEGGATAILGSLVAMLRPVPVLWLDASRWPAVVTSVMLSGIVVGRVLFAVLSTRLSEKAIIALCLVCGFFALPAAFLPAVWAYVPALFLTGVCFSATWPAFFGLVARAYPAERTFLSFGGAFFTALGVAGCVYLASAIGNIQSGLPYAFVASTAVMIPFASFLYLTPYGRRLTSRPA